VKCDLIRFITAEAVRMLVALRQRHPDVLDALPAPYGVASDRVEAGPDEAYRPVGRLTAAREPHIHPLGGPGRVRSGLTRARGLGAGIGLSGDRLVVTVVLPGQGEDVKGVRLWFQPLGPAEYTMRDLAVRQPGDSGALLRVDRDGAAWRKADLERFRRVPHPHPRWVAADEVRWAWSTDVVRLDVPLPRPEREGTAFELGFNLFVDYADGGWTALALHEPFVALAADLRNEGPLVLDGPERHGEDPATAADHLNGRMPPELMPLGRWTGLQANTC
jgi:hypothetical protein